MKKFATAAKEVIDQSIQVFTISLQTEQEAPTTILDSLNCFCLRSTNWSEVQLMFPFQVRVI